MKTGITSKTICFAPKRSASYKDFTMSLIICNIYNTCMHIVQVVTYPSDLKNGQSNITLVGYHGQPKLTSNIVQCSIVIY